MARNDPQMNLRVPMDLKEKIEKAAFDNGRTITAEAVYRLEKSFDEPLIFNPNDIDTITKLMAKSMDRLLSALREEGVESDQIMNALQNIANK